MTPNTSQPPIDTAVAMPRPAAETEQPGDHAHLESKVPDVAGSDFHTANRTCESTWATGGVDQTPGDEAIVESKGVDVSGPFLADPLLGVLADVVEDLEEVRCRSENRLRALTGEHGLSVLNPEVARLATQVEALQAAEHQAVLNMCRVMRKHPLWPWAKQVRGCGEKQFARLLATVGDPYWNDLYDRPRRCRELRAFCGLHVNELPAAKNTSESESSRGGGTEHHPGDNLAAGSESPYVSGVAPRRRRGQRSNWNENARKRLWLIENKLIQLGDPHYRTIYDTTRTKYAAAVHTAECVRCGPAGKPAQPGSPLSLGHQHARGLRKVGSEFLKDLWIEARRLHGATGIVEVAA